MTSLTLCLHDYRISVHSLAEPNRLTLNITKRPFSMVMRLKS